MFNIGNFYKILAFEADVLTVELVSIPKDYPLERSDPISSILLFQLKIAKISTLKQGQWYSLILSGL